MHEPARFQEDPIVKEVTLKDLTRHVLERPRPPGNDSPLLPATIEQFCGYRSVFRSYCFMETARSVRLTVVFPNHCIQPHLRLRVGVDVYERSPRRDGVVAPDPGVPPLGGAPLPARLPRVMAPGLLVAQTTGGRSRAPHPGADYARRRARGARGTRSDEHTARIRLVIFRRRSTGRRRA